MARDSSGNALKANQNLPLHEITLEDLDFLDSAVTQAEIGLLEHYFGDILKDRMLKGPA